MLLPSAVIARSTCTNFSRLYQVMGYCHPHPTLPRKRGREFEYGGNSWRWPVWECGKVRPFARPSGDLACGRHSSLSNRADAFNSVFERRRTAMPKGTVKKIVSDRGFGFIAADDGKEYFFHQSGVDTSLNFDSLRGGEAVSFDIEQSQKGPRANHVRAA